MRLYVLKSTLRREGEVLRPGAEIGVDEDDAEMVALLERMTARGDAEHIGGEVPAGRSPQGGGGNETDDGTSSSPSKSAPARKSGARDVTHVMTREEAIRQAMRAADPKTFTSSGKPKIEDVVPAAAKLFGAAIELKAAERDALWAEVQAKKSAD